MVETPPTSNRTSAAVPDTAIPAGDGRGRILPIPAGPRPTGMVGRPGNRWPSARELAGLLVNGILTLPARYRRGMFLDILV